jgi:hypothetical protein
MKDEDELFLNVANIIGFELFGNYEISESGVMRNRVTGRSLQGYIDNKGYVRFSLSQNGSVKQIRKHKALGELWVYNEFDKDLVDHVDGNRQNNTISNLRWSSHSENSQNRRLTHLNTSGEMNIRKDKSKKLLYWKVEFGNSRSGNNHRKLFKRDFNSDEIPQHVINYRNAYSLKWKGAFCPSLRFKEFETYVLKRAQLG